MTTDNRTNEPTDDREEILRKALEHVMEVDESGLAGPYVHDLPKDVDSNWGWLQTMWPVAVAVDIALASRTTVPDAATAAQVKKIILESLVFTNENSDPWAQLLAENILASLDGAPEPEEKP